MKKITIITLPIIIALLLLAACSSSTLDDKKSAIIGRILTVNNVPYTSVHSNGDKVEIFYESSSATNYDAQMINDWGMIFSTSANLNYSEITIVNTINDEPAAKITANGDNVRLLGNGWLNESEFWDSVKIESVP